MCLVKLDIQSIQNRFWAAHFLNRNMKWLLRLHIGKKLNIYVYKPVFVFINAVFMFLRQCLRLRNTV